MTQPSAPPKPRKEPQTFHRHGRQRTDAYGWMRDADWQKVVAEPARLAEDIRAHLQAENRHAEAFLAPAAPLREELFAEMKARTPERDTSAPLPHGPWAYYSRQVKGGEHPLFCRKPVQRGAGKAQVLLDGNREARGHAYFKIGCAHHSPDHRRLAWSYDISGGEEYLLRIRDLGGVRRDLPAQIARTDGDCVWSRDGRHLFYVRLDEQHRPRFVFRHLVGSDPEDDRLVFEQKDGRFFVSIEGFGGGAHIGIGSADHDSAEWRLLDAEDETAKPVLVREREADIEYDLHFDAARQRWLVRANTGGAREFRLLCAEAGDIAAPEKWRPWLPHDRQRHIEDVLCLQDHVLVLTRENALPVLHVFAPNGAPVRRLRFGEPAYELALIEGYEHPARQARLFYSSMRTPATWFDYDPAANRRRRRKRFQPQGGFSSSNYATERLHIEAADGASIPVSLLRRKDAPADGSAPLLLYGYGAYGISTPAGFSLPRMSLVDRGFVYAIAHVRGGRERGQGWYLDGKGENKQNSFGDFRAVARGLIAQGRARKGGIHAWGGSAGGLLMGAVANQEPDLFRCIVAEVPFVDVLATMLDETLPLTPIEWLEWGNPLASPQDYDRIAAYSPVDCARAQAYPFVLATAGVSDPRVGYWEPAKWVARLREATTSGRAVLLRTEMDAGHGGGAGRYRRLKEIAFLYGFVMQTAGLAPTPSESRW